MILDTFKSWLTGDSDLDPDGEPVDATERLIAALEARVSGDSPDSWISILESACRLYRDCMAVCEVEGAPTGLNLGGGFLADIATDLCRKGESLYLIDVAPMRLTRVAQWDVYGGAAESSWVYDCYLAGPSTTETIRRQSSGVVHIRQRTAPATPWRGVPGWGTAAGLAACLDMSMRFEAAGNVGQIMTMPRLSGQAEEVRETKAQYLQALKTLRGRSFVVERQADKVADYGETARSPRDWDPRRLGPEFTPSEVGLYDSETSRVCSAMGVPPQLFDAKATGNGLREAWRRFLSTAFPAMGRVIEDELTAKLEQEISLNTKALRAADLATRARAVSSLVAAGVKVDRALELGGFE